MSQIESTQLLNDEADLLYVNDIRKKIVNTKIKNGIPDDPEEVNLVLKALDGIDRSALTRTRIKSDAKNTQTLANSAGLIAELLKQVNPNNFKSEPVNRVIPELGKEFTAPKTVVGETDIGTNPLSYEKILAGIEDDHSAL